jgi:hypothetical protein
MPPRPVVLLIVLFWVAATAWLVRRDVWPRLRPGEPPPLEQDLTPEAQVAQTPVPWRAILTRRHLRAEFAVKTLVTYHERDDTFALHCWLRPRTSTPKEDDFRPLAGADSTLRVSREGWLLGLDAEVRTVTDLRIALEERVITCRGTVRDGALALEWHRRGRLEDERDRRELEGLPDNGVLLVPLHPAPRLPGLAPGRRWGTRLFDPVSAALDLSADPADLPWVDAVVRDRPEPLRMLSRDHQCLVVDYEGGDHAGEVWVDRADGQVLKVVARSGDDRWEITRE